MKLRRVSSWNTLGVAAIGTVVGLAAGAAAGAMVRARTRPRMLGTPGEVPPRPLATDERFPHEDFTPVLAAVVTDDGLVDYPALCAEPEALFRYVGWVEAYSPLNTPEHFPTESDQTAYWINAYNALALLAVLHVYPVRSVALIPPVGRYFTMLRFPVGGRLMSLHDIMQGIIHSSGYDVRILFALNSGIMGSPSLRREAYLPDTLQEQLESQLCAFVSDATKNRVEESHRTVWLHPLFRWYRDDIIAWVREHRPDLPEDVLSFMLPYFGAETQEMIAAGNIRLRYLPFDWRLNCAPVTEMRKAA